MGFEELVKHGLVLALLASMGGCSIRYATDYKDNGSIKYSFFIIDLLIAVFLGYFSFWYSIEELHFKSINAILNNIVIGNLGSRFFSIIQNIFLARLNIFLEKILGEPISLDSHLIDSKFKNKLDHQKIHQDQQDYQDHQDPIIQESKESKESRKSKGSNSTINKEGNDGD